MLSSESTGAFKRKQFRKPTTLANGKLKEVPKNKKGIVLRSRPRGTHNKRLEDDNVTRKEAQWSKSLSEGSRTNSNWKQRALAGELPDEDPKKGRSISLRSGPRNKRLDDGNSTLTEPRKWKLRLEDPKRESIRKHRAPSDGKMGESSNKRLNGRNTESNGLDNKCKFSRKPKLLSNEKLAEISNSRRKQPLTRLDSHSIPSKRLKEESATFRKGKPSQKQKPPINGNQDEAPKRRKRKKPAIRLDPYDTSNKRIDDGIAMPELPNPKPKDAKPDGLSKNAQFRAIIPSQPILTFVENNLLGRRRPNELQKAGYNTDLSAPLDNIPFSSSEERERIEDNIFRNKLNFFAAAKVESSLPPPNLPEIAFAGVEMFKRFVFCVICEYPGRSNVGKSSLLNSLTRQWGVARTSEKPGLTQTINFFGLGSKLCLVDLPGYGFAYAKDEVKDAWEELVKEYVTSRSSLKRVCLLVDTKWGMKARDYELVHLMEGFRTNYQIVMTKSDLVFPLDVARRAMQIEENLKANRYLVHPLMMVSSKSGAGIRCLRTVLSKIARFA